ncbi:MAG: histidine phosphatase family protein [Planctomycetota bacterium]
MKVVLIPCASTEWHEAGRLLGRVELHATSAGEDRCCEWIGELQTLGLAQLFHAPDDLATRTAKLLGRQLLVPTKAIDGLAEVDVGLWAGLTEDQLKSRYASAHRELCESPLNVSPPGGESLGAADLRLKAFLKKQTKRGDNGPVGLVLRPVSFAMARCMLEGRESKAVWETAQHMEHPVVIDLDQQAVRTEH